MGSQRFGHDWGIFIHALYVINADVLLYLFYPLKHPPLSLTVLSSIIFWFFLLWEYAFGGIDFSICPRDVFPLPAFQDLGIMYIKGSNSYICNFHLLNSTLLKKILHYCWMFPSTGVINLAGLKLIIYLSSKLSCSFLSLLMVSTSSNHPLSFLVSQTHLCCVANQLTNHEDSRRFTRPLLWSLLSLLVTLFRALSSLT